MEDSCFNLAYQGTRLEDCLNVKNSKEDGIIVIDKNEVYGSTFDGIEKLKNSHLVNDVEVFKSNSNFLIEAFPMFLRPKSKIFEEICESSAVNFCEFIPIENHFLILEDSKYYKIPYTKTQLVDTVYFNFKERHLINKFVRGEVDVNELTRSLSDKTKRILFNGIVGDQTNYEQCLEEYFSNFGLKPFIYPKHGLRDLSEIISRSNAMCGVAYLLNKDIKIYSINIYEPGKFNTKDIDSMDIDNTKNIENLNDTKLLSNKMNKLSTSLEEESKELLDRFSSVRISTDDEDYCDEFEEISGEKDYTGRINPEYCAKKHLKNNSGCFNPLKCDSKSTDCHLEGLFYDSETVLCTKEKLIKKREAIRIKPKDSEEDIFVDLAEIFSDEEDLSCTISSFEEPKEVDNVSLVNQISSEIIFKRAKEGYKYLITSHLGDVYVKSIIKNNVKGSNTYVRVMNLKEKLIESRFFAYFYNGTSFIKVLAIDSTSKCCTDGTYLIYLIKENSKINEKDLHILKIHSCNVISDISFKTNEILQTRYN